jgi:hypothetical protein
LAQIGDYVRAAKDADELAMQAELKYAAVLLNMACTYARCVEAAGKDTKLPVMQRTRLVERFAGRAIDCLGHAIAKEYRNATAYKPGPELSPLRERDIRKLLAQLELDGKHKNLP